MTDKAQALEAIDKMPESASMREIVERLAFMAGIREGLEQLDRGERIPISTVEKKIRAWPTK